MFARIYSAATLGLQSYLVECEVDLGRGQANTFLVGLPDKAVRESVTRFIAAIRNSGYDYPNSKKLAINLAPADLPKEGTWYDLPMAVGIVLNSLGHFFDSQGKLFIGELSLEGVVKKAKALLPALFFAKENGFKEVYIPASNLDEVRVISGIKIFPVENLRQLIEHLLNYKKIKPLLYEKFVLEEYNDDSAFDMKYIKGQVLARRALEIAAAGAHNFLMSGPPGAGKTFMARTLATILPALKEAELLELMKIYSVADLLNEKSLLRGLRPFRAVHHSVSGAALIGGGRYPKPGEITLAHRGVLFLDELPEFPRQVLEMLRQPLEDGRVAIARTNGHVVFPSSFILVAAQNPCACGYYGDPKRECTCSPLRLNQYQNKISGPLLDRIDLNLDLLPVELLDLMNNETEPESSAVVRARVERARQIQAERFSSLGLLTNAEMRNQDIKKFVALSSSDKEWLMKIIANLSLSARAYFRVLKVARTIADLAGEKLVLREHILESLSYRK